MTEQDIIEDGAKETAAYFADQKRIDKITDEIRELEAEREKLKSLGMRWFELSCISELKKKIEARAQELTAACSGCAGASVHHTCGAEPDALEATIAKQREIAYGEGGE